MKHFISEMKADFELCASLFNVVILPVLSIWSTSSRHMSMASLEFHPVFLQLKKCFAWGRKWIVLSG